jgi:hypothetical protein
MEKSKKKKRKKKKKMAGEENRRACSQDFQLHVDGSGVDVSN